MRASRPGGGECLTYKRQVPLGWQTMVPEEIQPGAFRHLLEDPTERLGDEERLLHGE